MSKRVLDEDQEVGLVNKKAEQLDFETGLFLDVEENTEEIIEKEENDAYDELYDIYSTLNNFLRSTNLKTKFSYEDFCEFYLDNQN